MAELSLVLACSHSGFLYNDPNQWNELRAKRSLRPDVPFDSDAECVAKFARCRAGFEALRDKIESVNPDVLLVFGDDQYEMFRFDNNPAFAIFLGESYAGPKRRGERQVTGATGAGGITIEATVMNCVPLASQLLEGLIDRDFDVAFSLEMPPSARGMGHAFMRPGYYLTPGYPIPTVPIFINCYYAPQPHAARCVALGQAVRQVIEQSPLNLRVAVIGSGGLWHTPGAEGSYLDESFDRIVLGLMEEGDPEGAAAYYDAAPSDPNDGRAFARALDGGTGRQGGVGGGTGEWRNWMAAAGVAHGKRAHVLDYVPVYASPLGASFAYWE
jgi:Catalytic LigB subunit of aromatic ring-opening dioxygenase